MPLPTLLSQVLVAFTIELDNEFERRLPHWITGSKSGSRQGPWLVSMVMWWNCMRFVGAEGVTVGELLKLAHTDTNLKGMVRWGYVELSPGPAGDRAKAPIRDWAIRATQKGRRAQEVWRPLFGEIEKRWEERFGKNEIAQLRKSLSEVLRSLTGQIDVELPDCLPILGYGLFCKRPSDVRRVLAKRAERGKKTIPEARDVGGGSQLPLPALLSKVLLAFAIEFELESKLSLAICANVMRVLDEKGVRLRALPSLSGVSKEGINMAMTFLKNSGYIAIERDPRESRTRLVRLTSNGREAQKAYGERLGAIEKLWQERFGKDTVRNLRDSLERLIGNGSAQQSPLFRGLEPHPDGWRASVRKLEMLPHFPMVLHRGGYPDGS
jgi:DNA-binding MarR family transcriptional regulator